MIKKTLHLCKGCIEDLKEYNPYIDDNGNTIPIEDMEIIETDIKHCENTNLFKKSKNKKRYYCDCCGKELKNDMVYRQGFTGVYCSYNCLIRYTDETIVKTKFSEKIYKTIKEGKK